MNSLERKLIKLKIKNFVQEHEIDYAINYLEDVEPSYLDFAYNFLTKQIKKKIKMTSSQKDFLSQAQTLYTSLKNK